MPLPTRLPLSVNIQRWRFLATWQRARRLAPAAPPLTCLFPFFFVTFLFPKIFLSHFFFLRPFRRSTLRSFARSHARPTFCPAFFYLLPREPEREKCNGGGGGRGGSSGETEPRTVTDYYRCGLPVFR